MQRENWAEKKLTSEEKKLRKKLGDSVPVDAKLDDFAASGVSESAFWKVLKKVGKPVARAALTLYYAFSKASVSDKFIIAVALAYLVLPVDFIPDFIPLLGYGDDLSVMAIALRKIKASITEEVKAQVDERLELWLP